MTTPEQSSPDHSDQSERKAKLQAILERANQTPNHPDVMNLFRKPVFQSLYITYHELSELISEYEQRANATGTAAVTEAASAVITKRGAVEKSAAAKDLREKLLNFILQPSSSESQEVINIPAEHQPQYLDNGRLLQVYCKMLALINFKSQQKQAESAPRIAQAPTNAQQKSFNQTFNKICFAFLGHIKSIITADELTTMCLNHHFLYSGAALDTLPTVYTADFDYTLAYSNFIKGFNNACEYFSAETNLLNKISIAIYETPVDILDMMKTWLCAHSSDGLITRQENFKPLIKGFTNSKSDSSSVNTIEVEYSKNPLLAESAAGKAEVNFSAYSDAMADTNIPSLLSFFSAKDQNGNIISPQPAQSFVRMGCQTRTVDCKMQVYPSFLRYIEALKQQRPSDTETTFLYISNLRTDNDTVGQLEATIEGYRNNALQKAAESTQGLEFVIMPANRSFLAPKQREGVFPVDTMDSFIAELAKIVLNNGQDFYLSESVRAKLFTSHDKAGQYTEIKDWIHQAILDLYHEEQQPFEISAAQRQQIATHFFKFTFTDKLISKLQPYRVATPCKDNIDRGAVHSIYYHIIKMIKELDAVLENKDNPTRTDQDMIKNLGEKITELLNKDIHCASLLVKGRAVNHDNFGLLQHALEGFKNGPYQHSPAFVASLKYWITVNRAATSFDSPTTNSPTGAQSDNSPTSVKQAAIEIDLKQVSTRGIFKRPNGVTIPPAIAQTATAALGASDIARTAGRILRDTARAGASAIVGGATGIYGYLWPAAGAITNAPDTDGVIEEQWTEVSQAQASAAPSSSPE